VELLMGWVEGAGIVIIAVGLLASTVTFLYAVCARRASLDQLYASYRRRLGQAILLGLELLVAADIIGTVMIEPTFASVGVLGLIVLVRTFLSMALEVEMDGRLPWKRNDTA
jgi:uncharacterized membrane protein